MNGRVTLLLVVVALVAGVYVFAFDRPKQAEIADQEAAAKKVFALAAADVRALELPLADSDDRAQLMRREDSDGWTLSAPLAVPADESAVESLLRSLVNLSSELEVARDSDTEAGFAFDESKAVVITPKEGEPIRLVPGADTPVGSLRYLTVSSRPETILAVPSYSLDALEPELFKLRDKAVTHLEPADVRAIEVEREGAGVARVRLEHVEAEAEAVAADDPRFKGEASWRVREPLDTQADTNRILQLLQSFSFARAEAIEDPPIEPARFGLDKPVVRVRLFGQGEEIDEIAFGKTQDAVHVRVDGEGPVLRVEQRLLDILPVELFDYRFKRVLSLRRDEIESLRLIFPRSQRELTLIGEGDDWVIGSDSAKASGTPASEEKPLLDNGRVEGAIYELDFLQAKGVVEQPDVAKLGLEPPRVRLELLGAVDAPVRWIELGDRQADGRVPARSSTGDQVWLLDASIAEKLPYGAETFDAEWLAKGDPPEDAPAPAEAGSQGAASHGPTP